MFPAPLQTKVKLINHVKEKNLWQNHENDDLAAILTENHEKLLISNK